MVNSPLAQGFQFPPASLVVGWFLFGSIGMVAVGYAKLKEAWQFALIGFALMFYPYLFPTGLGFWLIGSLLTSILLVPSRFRGF